MAGIDPLGGAGNAGLAALVDAEIAALAADAEALSQLLSAGDVVAARVLRSNGMTDLVEIAGRRVAAALPPDLHPGDVVAVKVLAVDAGRVTVRMVQGAAPAGAPGTAPRAPAPSPPSAARSPAAMPASPGSAAPPGRGAAGAPPPVSATSSAAPAPSPDATGALEARLAAARAARPDAARASAPAGSLAPRAFAAAPPRTFVAPPLVQSSPSSPAPAPAPPAAPAGPPAFAEPAALLRGLRLPVTATNAALARLALESPAKAENALAVLARALDGASDPRAGAVRSLLAFVTRIEPQSPALETQIAAYVDHVLTGPEPKLAQAAAALHAAPSAAPPLPALARAAERATAAAFDVKSQIVALAAEPQTDTSPALAGAITGALTALTAVQLNAASMLDAQPSAIAFSLPLALPGGAVRADVRVDRDAPHQPHGVPLDGDNFHIAFVLQTQHLGTVALDLVTVGRTVSVSVKTEDAAAARTFGTAVDGLTRRLKKLRYRVAHADAVVAPYGAARAEPAAPSAPPAARRATTGVDRSA